MGRLKTASGESALSRRRGRAQVQKTCRGLVDSLSLSFDLLLHSPLLRARQTADVFCDFFPVKKREESDRLKPDREVEPLFETMGAASVSSLALVGHQPFLSEFISVSLAGKGRIFVSLSRGGMAFLEFPSPPLPGSAVLTALLNPPVSFS